eukprot:TRINITY_DN9079_c0_g1_i1.p1 TRINITY_DN9079_c0_g1~~TRINITY_DN9079_c0_g1_i1.p1  ORF type:complete len:181 (+),score=56.02 TRINITY_DN9079_c0_g1_i1:55-543(+)
MGRDVGRLLLLPCLVYKLLIGILLDAPHLAGWDVFCERPGGAEGWSAERCAAVSGAIDLGMMKEAMLREDPLGHYMYAHHVTVPKARSFAACAVLALLLLTLLLRFPRRLAGFAAGAWWVVAAASCYGSLSHPKTPPPAQYFHSTPALLELVGPVLLAVAYG